MSQVIYAPDRVHMRANKIVFLAGSIEMGRAVDWQTTLIERLSDLDVTILNPRCRDWDSSWKQSIDHPQFREQVEWELDGLDSSHVIALYFDPQTKSPISLLELGLFARRGNLIVYCPEGFWRKGNVDIVAARYGLPVYGDSESFTQAIITALS